MSKIERLISENNSNPINGFTNKPYKNSNYTNLTNSLKKNEFKYNIWFSENQCNKMNLKILDNEKSTPTMNKNGVIHFVYNLSQTDYFKTKEKSVSKPSIKKTVEMERIEMLESLVINLCDKLDLNIKDILNVDTPSNNDDYEKVDDVIETPKINQTKLGKLLKLPQNVIRYLKNENIIKWEKVGKEILFDETSIKEFQKTFNSDDYIHSIKCSEKLQRWGFYDVCVNNRMGVHHPLKISVNMENLLDDKNGDFKEYKLNYVKFDTTVFVEKKSFVKTLNWLRNLNHKVNPKLSKEREQRMMDLFNENKGKRKNKRGKFNKTYQNLHKKIFIPNVG